MTSQEELLTFVKDKIKQLNDIGKEMLAAGNHASKEYRKGAIDTYDIIRIKLEGKVKFAEEPEPPKKSAQGKSKSATTLENKALILGQLWINNKEEDEWSEFFEYNDLSLPLAFALAEEIIDLTPKLEEYINESWDLLLKGMDIEDIGYEHFDELVDKQNE
jgi:hypothetical protein